MITTDLEIKREIVNALAICARGPLLTGATRLFAALGYSSERRVELDGVADFVASFDRDGRLNPDNALLGNWKSVDMLFQLTGEELKQAGQLSLFDAHGFNRNMYKAFLFFAIDLREQRYTRTQLAGITREINKLFQMPVSVLFRHGSALTLSIVTHRPNKIDAARDVLEKVSLIKDVTFSDTHRAHIEILSDLALPTLAAAETIAGFDDLQQAWTRALDSSELNRRFFRELANWYFWAVDRVEFPADVEQNRDVRNATGVIRLITRLMFVWFLREKRLVPDDLFDRGRLGRLLASMADGESTYYKAVLQNLFFATLNTEMRNPAAPRKFRNRSDSGGRDLNVVSHNVYHYQDLFRDADEALALFADVPFLNGGLFECLDRTDDTYKTIYIDGFSDYPQNPLAVPNELFFGREREVDLNVIYDTRGKRYKVRGLIDILNSYKFTIAENTPIEEEVALDPELLGQVFENLLANYDPETRTTARKQTGSFYTPREIVNYMVDESLLAYLERHLAGASRLIAGVEARPGESVRERLQHLLAYTDEPPQFNEVEIRALIIAIDSLAILDPACGSGAFPMGILHKLVHILSRLDSGNHRWKQQQLDRVQTISDALAREAAIESIEEAFERNELDYGRKLFLLENCIYGVDIQPIAVQIAKLRCFIALIVDEKIDNDRENRGVRPLPNLETKFVAANTLIGIQRSGQLRLRDPDIEAKEQELKVVRSRHFNARTPQTKAKWRRRDGELRKELSALLMRDAFSGNTATLLASWDPYDQNASAKFYDTEWMFGINERFDIVIGNPPYGAEISKDEIKVIQRQIKDTKNMNSAALFIDISKNVLLSDYGIIAFIVPKSLLYSEKWFTLVQSLSRNTSVIVDVEQAFDNVLLEQVVFVYSAKKQYQSYMARKFVDGKFIRNTPISLSTVEKFEAWICDVSVPEINLAQKMLSSDKFFKDITESSRGLPLQRDLTDNGGYPVIGGKNITRYALKGVKGYISKSVIKNNKRAQLMLRPKVVSQQIVSHIQNPRPHIMIISSVDRDGSVIGVDTVENTYAMDASIHVNTICALLNSKLINWYAYKFIFCSAVRTMHFDAYYIGKIPIPIKLEELQEEIVDLVDKVVEFKSTNSLSQINVIQQSIDNLIYQLYELAPDEISLVKGEMIGN